MDKALQTNVLVLCGALGLSTFASAALARTTIVAVSPSTESALPTNAEIWISATSTEGPTLEITVTQNGIERIMQTELPECCFAYRVGLGPLAPGEVDLTISPPDGEAWTATYSVTPDADTVAPSIAGPMLSLYAQDSYEPRNFYLVEANYADSEDDWGIATMLPEFDSEMPRPLVAGLFANPEPRWEFGNPLIGPDEIDFGGRAIYRSFRKTACARATAVDLGGNRTLSETTCIDLAPPTPIELLRDQVEEGCSCTKTSYTKTKARDRNLAGVALLCAMSAPLLTRRQARKRAG